MERSSYSYCCPTMAGHTRRNMAIVGHRVGVCLFTLRSKNARLHITASNSEVDNTRKMKPVICDCTEHLVRASVERPGAHRQLFLDHIPCSSIHRILSCRVSFPANECVYLLPYFSRLELATLEPLVLANDSLSLSLFAHPRWRVSRYATSVLLTGRHSSNSLLCIQYVRSFSG